MISPSRLLNLAALVASLLVFAAVPADAVADELAGTVSDAATGIAISGAAVRVMGTDKSTTTDEDGRFVFDLPEGGYELGVEASFGDEDYQARLVNQRVPQYRAARVLVYTDYFLEQGHEPRANAPGLPSTSGRLDDDAPDSVDLSDLFEDFDPTHLTIPDTPPTTIRVGRRQDHTGEQGCTDSTNPIVAIDEMHLDEYVKGVLPPEIGVFQNIPGAPEVYKTFAIAAKSYALYFMLVYDSNNRRTIDRTVPPHDYDWFHIDDTACNQRYSDDRMTITTEAAEAVQSKILVDKSDADSLGKYEYAASCGENGTRPEHQDAIVPDDPGVSACAGSWCGHDDCAGHEDHPDVPGTDRCLVRGICQWGAASWGEAGKSYTWMLDHYQPNLQVREIGNSGPETVALVGYTYTDSNDIAGSGVADVTIDLSDGQTTRTDDAGQYRFDAVEVSLGTVDITASKAGYRTATRDKELESGQTNWGSVQIEAGSNSGEDAGVVADAGDAAGSADADTDGGDQPDATHADDVDNSSATDSGLETASTLGPLVQESKGVEGGCSTSGAPGPPPLGLIGLLAGCLVLGFGRLRT
ncbi:MAG: carboxypeptidase regulatory-like domain-containing protein [Persicimonas sp.]